MASSDKGTAAAGGAKGKGWVHPDYPQLDLNKLRSHAANFDIDVNLVALLFKEPFYADIIRSLHKVADESIGTAGVLFKDGIMNFWWNPLFLAAYPGHVVGGVLKHEALHLALEHTTTRRYKPHAIWNIATDLAINSAIPGEELPPCGFRPGSPLKRPHNWGELTPEQQAKHEHISGLVASMALDLAAEEYFSILMSDPQVQKRAKSEGEGDGIESMDNHDGWDSLSDEEREYVAGKVRQVVKEAQERADSKNSWGSVSNAMREEIRKRVRGEIDWKSVLRNFVGTTTRADRISSVYRVNRKYPGIHSGHSRDYKPTLNCYIDQSGSMSDDDIMLCFNELASLSQRVTINVYHFDTEIDESSKTVWSAGCPMPKALRTRCGGTDFRAPTEHAIKTKPDGYIILTDGGADKPASSLIKRCWVLVPGTSLAWGEAEARDVVVKMKKPLPKGS